MIEINIKTNNRCFKDDSISVIVEIINLTDNDIFFLKRGTPFDSILSDCLIVLHNNELIPFDGFVLMSDYIVKSEVICIKPNKPKKKKIVLSKSYRIKGPGDYIITLKDSIKLHFAESREFFFTSYYNEQLIQFDKKNKETNINNNSYILKLSDSDKINFSYLKTIGEIYRRTTDDISTGIIFEGDFLNQQKTDKIVEITDYIISFSINFLLSNMNELLVDKWFGRINRNNEILIKENYSRILNKIGEKNICYYIYKKKEVGDDLKHFAITSLEGSKIWIYSKKFWEANDKDGFKTKFGVLVHEFSHIACSFPDNGREVDDAIRIARDTPIDAIRSPNNYIFYLEELL